MGSSNQKKGKLVVPSWPGAGMQQFLMDYSNGLSGDRDIYYCPFAVM